MLKEKLAAQFDFLKAKAPPLVGCDISSSSVKMVEIAEAGRNVYRVERYAIEPLPKDTVVDGNIANIEAAGLKTIVMDVEAYASQTAFELICGGASGISESDVTVIVDIGATVTRVTVVHNGQT